jgi:hypothetical protein
MRARLAPQQTRPSIYVRLAKVPVAAYRGRVENRRGTKCARTTFALMTGRWARQRPQRCALMMAKQRVPAPRGGHPNDLASKRGGCDRISLLRASMRPKIMSNNPAIWGMPVDSATRALAIEFRVKACYHRRRKTDYGCSPARDPYSLGFNIGLHSLVWSKKNR